MKKLLSFATLFAAPLAAFAQYVPGQQSGTGLGFDGLIGKFANLLSQLFPILVALAVLALFYEIIMFIFKGRENADDKKKYMAGIGWSVLAIVIMLTFFGFIRIIANTLGVGDAIGSDINQSDVVKVVL